MKQEEQISASTVSTHIFLSVAISLLPFHAQIHAWGEESEETVHEKFEAMLKDRHPSIDQAEEYPPSATNKLAFFHPGGQWDKACVYDPLLYTPTLNRFPFVTPFKDCVSVPTLAFATKQALKTGNTHVLQALLKRGKSSGIRSGATKDIDREKTPWQEASAAALSSESWTNPIPDAERWETKEEER